MAEMKINKKSQHTTKCIKHSWSLLSRRQLLICEVRQIFDLADYIEIECGSKSEIWLIAQPKIIAILDATFHTRNVAHNYEKPLNINICDAFYQFYFRTKSRKWN